VVNTLGLTIGSSFTTLVPMKDLVLGNVSSALTGQPAPQTVTGLMTADAYTILDPTYTVPGQYCIRQSQPYPATITGVFPRLQPSISTVKNVEIYQISFEQYAQMTEGMEGREILLSAAKLASEIIIGKYGEEILAFIGLVPPHILSDQAYVWMLTTVEGEAHPILLARYGKGVIDTALAKYRSPLRALLHGPIQILANLHGRGVCL